jgi:hypothetical protein
MKKKFFYWKELRYFQKFERIWLISKVFTYDSYIKTLIQEILIWKTLCVLKSKAKNMVFTHLWPNFCINHKCLWIKCDPNSYLRVGKCVEGSEGAKELLPLTIILIEWKWCRSKTKAHSFNSRTTVRQLFHQFQQIQANQISSVFRIHRGRTQPMPTGSKTEPHSFNF